MKKDIIMHIIKNKGNCSSKLYSFNFTCQDCPIPEVKCTSDLNTYKVAIELAIKYKLLTKEEVFEMLL